MKVVLTQSYVPEYRIPLFNAIATRLSDAGAEFVVAAGKPSRLQAQRGDESRGGPWHRDVPSRALNLGGRLVRCRTLPRDLKGADVLVTEFDAKNMLAWGVPPHGARKVVLWGHGKPYVTRTNRVNEQLKRLLVSRVAGVMTYTEGGRDHVVRSLGGDPDSVVAIGNAVDTHVARRARMEAASSGEGDDLRQRLGGGPHALYVGGLDASKRIDFLIAAAQALRGLNDGSRLIVCGDGVERARVEEAAAAGDVHFVGRVGRSQLGAVSASASAIWVPGRVGLVAVDAVALGLPLYTTDYAFHAPEIEFLREPWLQKLPDDPQAFASAALTLMESPLRGEPELLYDVDDVAQNFVNCVLRVGSLRP
ncbi:glycosyltransferase family 4 protein [Demequina sp. B12]|uniref:glycosyltransferase family 4 protein n=1 Tax=Demequina sp. B12 TaxID=2992757 RepID=UPI00237A9254|nr:glycosyltransferase family 4 protein [Demequina sp. B12]MDE0573652.1 glycosyltransferase family 4 protein [Demequina sp. B12]